MIEDCGCQKTSLDRPGSDYEGKMARTVSGKRCQRWDKQTPHKHPHKPYPSASIENYCRNPDSKVGGVWCYTEDPDTEWEYCSHIQGIFDKILFFYNRLKTVNQHVKHLVITTEIILGGTIRALFQKLVPGLHANFGISKLHISTINQL